MSRTDSPKVTAIQGLRYNFSVFLNITLTEIVRRDWWTDDSTDLFKM